MASPRLGAVVKRHGLAMVLTRILFAAIGAVPTVVGLLLLNGVRQEAEILAPLNAIVDLDGVAPKSGPGDYSGTVEGEGADALRLVAIEARSESGSSHSYSTLCVLPSASEITLRSYGEDLTVSLPEPWGAIDASNLTTADGWALVRLGEPTSRTAATEEQLAQCPAARDRSGPTQRTWLLTPGTELAIFGCRQGDRVEPCPDGGSILVTKPADEALSLWLDDEGTRQLFALALLLLGGILGGGVAATGQLHNTGRRKEEP